MRIFITALILIISLQSWTKAEDIREFEIEGMSIGDSALDYFSEPEIKSNMRYLYKSKKYAMFCKEPDWLDPTYEGVCIEFKDNEEYIIESLIGKIFYNNKDFNKCFKQESVILIELKNLFENKSRYKDHGIRAHEGDPSGESKGSWHTFKLDDNSGWIYLECMDWTEEIGSYDNLRVTILGSEFGNFLNTEAY
tara:strand:- start:219 stop:800 length:582 start_codon:yes stop_codon:yes gene_type:complete